MRDTTEIRDKVVLVGGATKSPVIRRFVSKLFKTIPDTNVDPDEAVALGAAIQAAMKERKEAIREVILTDVCPFTLGTEVVREWEKGYFERGIFCPIISSPKARLLAAKRLSPWSTFTRIFVCPSWAV